MAAQDEDSGVEYEHTNGHANGRLNGHLKESVESSDQTSENIFLFAPNLIGMRQLPSRSLIPTSN